MTKHVLTKVDKMQYMSVVYRMYLAGNLEFGRSQTQTFIVSVYDMPIHCLLLSFNRVNVVKYQVS